MESSSINGDIMISGLCFCFVYLVLSALFEHKRVHFVHETSVAMTVGFLIGLLTFLVFNSRFDKVIALNDSIVFFILLPPMLFSDGFNLQKKRFFQNILYINIYGLLGTLFNFFTIAALIYLVSKNGLIRNFRDSQIVRQLSDWEILLFAASMCSVDNVASLSAIKSETHPKLFSVVFGESLMKDAVTIVLFNSITKLIKDNNNSYTFDFMWFSGFQILGHFLLTITVSILVGTAYSVLVTLLFKHCRFITYNRGITQLGVTFLCGYIAYITSELMGFSGIISMMTVGIFLSHFNIYNMSTEGLQSSRLAFKTIKVVAEGLLFLLLGIASWQFKNDSGSAAVSWALIGFGFVAIIAGRLANIGLTSLLFYFCVGKRKWRLNFDQLLIIGVSGLAKGAVPFALVTTLTLSQKNDQITILIVKSTVIAIVFISSLILNGLLPMFIDWRLKVMRQEAQQDRHSAVDTLREQVLEQLENEQKGKIWEEMKFKSETQRYWKKFQEGFLKPFLIYNYLKGRREEIIYDKKVKRLRQFGVPIEGKNKEEIQMMDLKQIFREKSHRYSIMSEEVSIIIFVKVNKDTFNGRRLSNTDRVGFGQIIRTTWAVITIDLIL